MAVTIQLAKKGAPVPNDEEVYILEPPPGNLNLLRLQEIARNQCQQSSLPAVLQWDDLIYAIGPRKTVRPYLLQWPHDDALLASSIKHSGRCAIRGDILHQLYAAGEITHQSDTSQAFANLAQAEKFFLELPGILRFVGWSQNKLYSPLNIPAPDKLAKSISIIINYRDRPDLMARCLQSIGKQRVHARLEVILVDNQSQPHNRKEIERQTSNLLPDPIQVNHLSYDAPFNHSRQSNLGSRKATGEVLLMLNNDAYFLDSDTVQKLGNWALMPNVATVGPRVLGYKQKLVSAGIHVYPETAKQPAGIRESTVVPLSKTVHSVAGNSFSCAAIARPVWDKLGGLWADRFPTQYNDADFCLRALENGFSHIFVGSQVIYHEPGQSETRTRISTEKLHKQLRDYHPNLNRYTRRAPVMIPAKTPPGNLVLNEPFLFKGLEAYRKWRKRFSI
jgi:GT2 family glycosyltransferase